MKSASNRLALRISSFLVFNVFISQRPHPSLYLQGAGESRKSSDILHKRILGRACGPNRDSAIIENELNAIPRLHTEPPANLERYRDLPLAAEGAGSSGHLYFPPTVRIIVYSGSTAFCILLHVSQPHQSSPLALRRSHTTSNLHPTPNFYTYQVLNSARRIESLRVQDTMRNNIVKSDPRRDSRDSNCLCAPCGESARRFSVGGGVSALSRLPRGEARGKEPRGEALAEVEKSYRQARKIVILIANPGIRTGRNSLKTKERSLL